MQNLHNVELPKLYDFHCPDYWTAIMWFACEMMHTTKLQQLGPVQDYCITRRRKKSARARCPKHLLTDWQKQHPPKGMVVGEYTYQILLPPEMGDFLMETLPPVSWGSRGYHANLIRLKHDEIFGPFEPEDRTGLCGAMKQRNRLMTYSNYPGFYSLRPYKRRNESLSVRKWKVRQREEAKRIRREQFEVFGPFVRDSRRLPVLNCDFNNLLMPLATVEQMAKYRYPDGPAKEKDPDGT
jgi:hypothetical protein